MIDTQRLRQKILDLAIRGKLVPQDPADEPASILLERIRQEKLQMVAEGKLKKKDIAKDSVIYRGDDSSHYEKVGDAEPVCIDDEIPFELPNGWAWARLSHLTAYLHRGKSPHYSSVKKYPVFAQKCNQPNFITLDKVKFADPETISRYGDECFLRDKDIVLNSTGTGTLGRVGLFREEFLKGWPCMIADSHVTVIRSKWLIPEYLYHFLRSEAGQAAIFQKQTGSTNQKELPTSAVESFLIPVPPSDEQHRIAETLQVLFDSLKHLEDAQIKLNELLGQARSKILDLAIRGKLVPQDPADEPAPILLERIRQEKLQMVAEGKLKKKDIAKDSVIYRGDDNSYYERTPNGEVRRLDVRLFDLPNNWSWVRLGCISNYGSAPSIGADEIEDDAWVLDLEDIEKDTGKILEFVTRLDRPSLSAKRPFRKGQLLYSKLRPYLNKVLIAPKEGYCTSEILPIELYGKCDPNYLRLALMSDYFLAYANQCSYGVKMPRLGTNDGLDALIPLPPLKEQENISNAAQNAATIIGFAFTK